MVTDIKYNSRCVDLDLPFSLCCDSCRSTLEAKSGILKKSSHKAKRFRDTSERRRCQQPWSSEHNKSFKPTATLQKFVRVREYLKIDCDVEIKKLYVNESRKKIKPQDSNTTSKCNTEGMNIDSSHVQSEVISSISVNTPGILPKPSTKQTGTTPSFIPTTNPEEHIENTISPTSPSIIPHLLRTITTPLTHDNPPIFQQCKLAADSYIESRLRPSNPPSAHSPVQSETQSNMSADTNANEPTRLAESSPLHPGESSTNTEKFRNSLYVNISRSKLRRLEKEASIGRKFLSAQKRKQYKSTKLGRLLHGIAIAHATKIGVNTLEKIITLSTMAFFANLGFTVCDLECITKLCPSATTLKTLMIDLAVDYVILMSEEMKNKN